MHFDYDFKPSDNNSEEDEKRFIDKEDAKPTNSSDSGHRQNFSCPECGSYNTGQSTYSDWCNSCGWSQGY